jgi:hypothetical protein
VNIKRLEKVRAFLQRKNFKAEDPMIYGLHAQRVKLFPLGSRQCLSVFWEGLGVEDIEGGLEMCGSPLDQYDKYVWDQETRDLVLIPKDSP